MNTENASHNPSVKKPWMKKHPILTGLGILIIIIIIASAGGSNEKATSVSHTSTKQEAKTEALVVSPETLRQAYKANEVNADNQYKGKFVEMSGTVDTIGKDIIDEAYITFETPEQYAFDKVQCMFKSTQEAPLGTLTKGQQVTVQGTVSGVTIGSVIVRNCTLLTS